MAEDDSHAGARARVRPKVGVVRLTIASIRSMGQSKFMRSIIDATQPEKRHGLA